MTSISLRTNLLITPAALLAVVMAGCTGSSGSTTSQSCLGTGQEVIQTTCVRCHNSAFAAAGVVPAGAVYETETEVRRLIDAIRTAALIDQRMPPSWTTVGL